MYGKTGALEASDLDAKAEFAQFFAQGWRIGATDPDRFLRHFAGRMTADAAMIQPLSPVFRGPDGLRNLFGPLFAAIPDLRGEVVRWGPTEDGVLVELNLRGTVGGRSVAWTTVDRIVLHEGLIAERRAYFDPLPLVRALLRRPRTSIKLLPALLGRKEPR